MYALGTQVRWRTFVQPRCAPLVSGHIRDNLVSGAEDSRHLRSLWPADPCRSSYFPCNTQGMHRAVRRAQGKERAGRGSQANSTSANLTLWIATNLRTDSFTYSRAHQNLFNFESTTVAWSAGELLDSRPIQFIVFLTEQISRKATCLSVVGSSFCQNRVPVLFTVFDFYRPECWFCISREYPGRSTRSGTHPICTTCVII